MATPGSGGFGATTRVLIDVDRWVVRTCWRPCELPVFHPSLVCRGYYERLDHARVSYVTGRVEFWEWCGGGVIGDVGVGVWV